jgi:hypothetical protein
MSNLILEARRLQKLAGILSEQDEEQQNQPIIPEPSTPATNAPIEPEQNTIQTINRDEAERLMKETKGKFFTVTFTKKDGTTRVMNARLGVKAYLKGGELPYNPEAKGLLPVYDVKTGDYRMINLKTVSHLKIGNNEYNVI